MNLNVSFQNSDETCAGLINKALCLASNPRPAHEPPHSADPIEEANFRAQLLTDGRREEWNSCVASVRAIKKETADHNAAVNGQLAAATEALKKWTYRIDEAAAAIAKAVADLQSATRARDVFQRGLPEVTAPSVTIDLPDLASLLADLKSAADTITAVPPTTDGTNEYLQPLCGSTFWNEK